MALPVRVPLAALLFVAFATVGCESKGPAERAGVSIDKGVQNAKDAIRSFRAPLRRLGGPWTAPSNPEPDEPLSVYDCQLAFEKQRSTARREKTKPSAQVAPSRTRRSVRVLFVTFTKRAAWPGLSAL